MKNINKIMMLNKYITIPTNININVSGHQSNVYYTLFHTGWADTYKFICTIPDDASSGDIGDIRVTDKIQIMAAINCRTNQPVDLYDISAESSDPMSTEKYGHPEDDCVFKFEFTEFGETIIAEEGTAFVVSKSTSALEELFKAYVLKYETAITAVDEDE